MPLTKKGQKVKAAMKKQYGSKKGEKVFYATENKGKVKGLTSKYARGGMVKANCGASMKPNRKGRK